ncbi:hypothetical protein EJ02DRAFT_36947 [Clathrospora elynae]|uniref:Uncharacterized protein n=1 Tax=Clathrospora elynae TaxID=706981 RepID=A0A6A5T4P0_9PLEO|nr:hypothetical protein EJ02DRAFT_36947 [Clathrospora elynae]
MRGIRHRIGQKMTSRAIYCYDSRAVALTNGRRGGRGKDIRRIALYRCFKLMVGALGLHVSWHQMAINLQEVQRQGCAPWAEHGCRLPRKWAALCLHSLSDGVDRPIGVSKLLACVTRPIATCMRSCLRVRKSIYSLSCTARLYNLVARLPRGALVFRKLLARSSVRARPRQMSRASANGTKSSPTASDMSQS